MSELTMKAAVYSRYGPPEVLGIVEVGRPTLKENEILVRVHASAVTSGDVRLRKAEPFMVRTFNGLTKPRKNILGINFAGTVEKVGGHVKEFKEGDEVFGSTAFKFGCYAEYVRISENEVIARKPANISFVEASVVPFGTLTSLHFLRQARIKEGQKVLVYGASGSLGTAGVQLAKHFGAEVTGVCSTANVDLVKSLGADRVIDYTRKDFADGSETYDVIYDAVGKSPFFGSLKKLNKDGIYLSAVHMPPLSFAKDLWALVKGRRLIGGISVERKADLEYLKGLMETGAIRPVIDRVFPMEQIADAHRYVEQGHKRGNVAVTILPAVT